MSTPAHSLAVACATLASLACGAGSEPVTPPSQRGLSSVVVALGQTVTLPGTTIQVRFERVESDSRCPSDVTCIWAGDAALTLAMGERSPSTPFLLHTNGQAGATRATVGGYEVEVSALDPSPVSTTRSDPQAYRLTLVVRSVSH